MYKTWEKIIITFPESFEASYNNIKIIMMNYLASRISILND